MTQEQFMDYYENQHSKLTKTKNLKSSMPTAQRYVRRYLTPEINPVTGEVLDPGYDCIMEIWWNSKDDFDNARKVINDPARLALLKEDEARLFASHSNPVCSVIEYDSPVGPDGIIPRVELVPST
jgi:translation initiation factor 2B subunit (eIF-2B alpha/beta/delta family)